jgi:tRNA pseudouridine55 synthase
VTTGTDGVLLVDKPAGVSSHDVVAAARRALKEKRIGHGGTLDPFATGLLVLLVGRATRLLQYVPDEPKDYDALVRFGAETDTEDLGGAVVRETPLPTIEALQAMAPSLVGRILQTPPAYSAKRVDGERAYEIARRGEVVVLKPVEITVESLTLSEFECTAEGTVARCRMQVSCGGGTYIRSLARDLARGAGSAAHLETLRRSRCGVFTLARAIPFEVLRDASRSRDAEDSSGGREQRVRVAPPIDALEGYPVQPLDAAEVTHVTRGIDVEARVAGDRVALIDGSGSGALVAFAERRPSERGDRWQPRVVMREAEPKPPKAEQHVDVPAVTVEPERGA